VDTIKLDVGTVTASTGGITQDLTRAVEFVGEEVASRTEYGLSRKTGAPTDSRGVDETLYRTDDDRLVVHVKDWSHWQSEPTSYSLHEVSEADLQVGGRFEALGAEAGFGRPLTLDEAVSARPSGPPL